MKNKPLIPFYGIDRFYGMHSDEILQITDGVYHTGSMLMGPEVSTFETALAAYCGRKHAIAVGSCTDALYFALVAGGIVAGDEVMVTCFSYLASATPILRAGARPVFVDIDPTTHQMDLDDLKSKITAKTKAVVAVHLYGQLLDIDSFEAIAAENNLLLIEDAAQALGSMRSDRPGGSMGEMSCISFDPTKIIGAFGNGGAVLTDDNDLNIQLRKLGYHGKNPENAKFEGLGYNSRIATVQAALLDYQLGLLPDIIERRNEIATIYNSQLGSTRGIELLPRDVQSQDNYHKFVIRTDKRDELRRHLTGKGIETNIHYDHLIPDQPIFSKQNCEPARLSVAESIKDKVLSLPIYPELNNGEVEQVCSEINLSQ